MVIRRFTAALVAPALAGLGIVALATPSHADFIGSCGAGIPAVGTTSGVVTTLDRDNIWYTTPTGGSFVITLTVPASATTDLSVGIAVWTPSCQDSPCSGWTNPSPTWSCSVTSATPLNMNVYLPYWNEFTQDGAFEYTVSVQSLPAIGGCNTTAGLTTCASVTGTAVAGTYAVTTASTNVLAQVDAYAFTLPGGGVVTLPCVVLTAGATPVNPCLSAGGTYSSTLFSLTQAASVPSTTGTPYAGINVCNANVVLTVNSLGVTSFPALTVC